MSNPIYGADGFHTTCYVVLSSDEFLPESPTICQESRFTTIRGAEFIRGAVE
jgi:hypothetical protein